MKLKQMASKVLCKNNGNNIQDSKTKTTYKELVLAEIDKSSFVKKYDLKKDISEDGLFKAYCKLLRNGNLWGGQIEIEILSDVLNVPIVVFDSGNIYIHGDGKDAQKIYIERINRNHYDALIPIRESL